MKIALIGQDIPTLLPTLLTDLLFAGKARDAEIALEEKNPAMGAVLQGYGDAVFRQAGLGGSLRTDTDREAVLRDADAVIYAGDLQPASRFAMDRSALSSGREAAEDGSEDPGLTDQARVNGGLGGLLHALRAGTEVFRLCDAMDKACPGALVINLGQPAARTTAMFLNRGYRCFGLGRTPLKGANGLDTVLKRMQIAPENASWQEAGLPGFAFLLKLEDNRLDLLPKLKRAVRNGEMGSLSRRWLDWWDAVPLGDVTDHAEFLPAQPDFMPEEEPEFGESVERRKERILYMNTVGQKGAEDREGAMAQLLLLSKAPPIRPMRLALALLRQETAEEPAVIRRNDGALPQLPAQAVVETALRLDHGTECTDPVLLPPALADVMVTIDEANRLAARAAAGDMEALRQYVETDPALDGLDRLYCMDVALALIRLHQDVLPAFEDL